MEKELVDLGLLKPAEIRKQDPDKPALKKYFMHGIGHPLGLDVHDVGLTTEPIQPGWVLTVEPGIYIPAEGLAVRLENDILVQEGGNVDLMADIPIEAEEIEALMDGGVMREKKSEVPSPKSERSPKPQSDFRSVPVSASGPWEFEFRISVFLRTSDFGLGISGFRYWLLTPFHASRITHHSYLSAWIGCSRAALKAGKRPAKTPTAALKATAMTIAPGVMTGALAVGLICSSTRTKP